VADLTHDVRTDDERCTMRTMVMWSMTTTRVQQYEVVVASRRGILEDGNSRYPSSVVMTLMDGSFELNDTSN